MKTILITAGGTIEPIDSARVITNTGTGRLGSLIADEFAKQEDIGRIFYVCAPTAVRPITDKAEITVIRSVDDLSEALSSISSEYRIDAVIHSMAVSDYTVSSVTTAGELAKYLADAMTSPAGQKETIGPESLENDPSTTAGVLEAGILSALMDTDIRKGGGKLSSKMKAPVLLLGQTKKVISSLRSLAPEAVIVGFKLMTDVSEEKLTETAIELMKKNSCNYVLANDSKNISGDMHKAILIGKNGIVAGFDTKQEIAAGIVSAVTEEV